MSEYTFKLPDLGEGTVEAEIAEGMVEVGDLVGIGVLDHVVVSRDGHYSFRSHALV